ncbi:DUF6261 family protein [Ancylomarina longa]|uniref:Uncharacterized protein n=1 Tax=Ancylomarina longa TaxID=2487017 RepID=A0A434AWK2_9BACT|nr:DUF6261 family protein [Ancylomarina longa]RUT78780.1 hypothetical protein DLK05_06490 [Ancylomarina longa]
MYSSNRLRELRNSEFIQFIKTFLSLLLARDTEALKLKSKTDELGGLFAEITAVFNPNLGNRISQELQELDSRRDNAFSGVEQAIKANCYHYEAPIRNAAKLLLDSRNNYDSGIVRLNYQAETSVLENIVRKWLGDPELSSALSVLNLTDWVNEIVEANTLFSTRYLDRLKEEAHAPTIKLADLRKQIMVSYGNLVEVIKAYQVISNKPDYADIIKESDQLEEEYNRILAMRSGSKKEEIPAAE